MLSHCPVVSSQFRPCSIRPISYSFKFTLNFSGPILDGFPHIPLFTGPSRCISSCTTRSQARKCGQLFPTYRDTPQRAAAQTNNNRGSYSKFLVSYLTYFLTVCSPFAELKRSTLRARKKSSTSVATGLSPSYRATSKTIRLPSLVMARRATDRASTPAIMA